MSKIFLKHFIGGQKPEFRIKLKPLDDNKKSIKIPMGKTIIGRGPFLRCSDKNVSKKHAVLEVTSKGEVFLTPIHVNPCFYEPTTHSPGQILEKNIPHKLQNGDSFSLLPHAFRYQMIVAGEIPNVMSDDMAVKVLMQLSCKDIEIPVGKTTIGRGPLLGCDDRKVSRNHAILEVTSKGEIFLTPTYVRPCFYQVTTYSPGRMLKKDIPHKLENGDTFSLLPRAFCFKLIVRRENAEDKSDQNYLNNQLGKTNGTVADSEESLLNEKIKSLLIS